MSRLATRRRDVAYAVAIGAVCAALTVTTLSASPAQAGQTYFVPVTKTWQLTGHGYGHGHGMSQYGAQGAALQGVKYAAITRFYYPHTEWGVVRGGVRVLISSDTTSDVQVAARKGLTLTDLATHRSWRLPTRHGVSRWRMTPADDGSTAVQRLTSRGWQPWKVPNGRGTLRSDGQFQASGPLTLFVPSGGGEVGRPYRGIVRSVRPYRGSTSRDTVNVVSMDQYVRGVVPYEMPTSWHQQALRAQAVAARSFATWQRAENAKRYYQICDTTSCQVYGGAAAEAASTNAATKATAGRILTYAGRPAYTQFSSSSGGWTSAGGLPYLPAKKDPYDDYPGNSMHTWTARVTASSLRAWHPEIGRLVSLHVTRRDGNGAWNGRVEQLKLVGSKGTVTLTGDDFRFHFGLKSTWFTIATTPIMKRWHHLGGSKSRLGRPSSGEYAVHGGAAQRFRHGRIYWSRRTGARDLQGPALRQYMSWGGPRSRLGFPLTGVMKAPRHGHKSRFEHGRIYSSTRTGAHVLYGPVLGRWGRLGAASGRLGYPTTDVHKIRGGLRAGFERGIISWDRSSGRATVRRR